MFKLHLAVASLCLAENAVWKHWLGPDLQTKKEVVYNFPFADDKLGDWSITSKSGNLELDEPVIERVDTTRDELNDLIYRNRDQQAIHFYRYRRGYVDCWIEVASGGKSEVIALISAQEMQKAVDDYYKKDGRRIPPDHAGGYIFWDPYSLGKDDPTLIVRCVVGGITYSLRVVKGTNHLIAEKWKDRAPAGWVSGFDRQFLPPGKEILLEAQRFSFGEHRLMVKLVDSGN
jgi:hypothetical protein